MMGNYKQINNSTFQPAKASPNPNLQKHQQRASPQQQEQGQSLEEMREMRHRFEAAGSTLLVSNSSPPETPPQSIQKKEDEEETAHDNGELENKISGGSGNFFVPELQMRREEVARFNKAFQARIAGQEQDFFIHQDSHSSPQNIAIQRQQQGQAPNPNAPRTVS